MHPGSVQGQPVMSGIHTVQTSSEKILKVESIEEKLAEERKDVFNVKKRTLKLKCTCIYVCFYLHYPLPF